jgi:uncharacterized membrane protein
MKLLPGCITLVLAALIAGCGHSSEQGEKNEAYAPGRSPPPTPVLDSPASLPAEFIVSTNEPTWQARVQGTDVLLSGSSGERSFRVEMNDAVFDGRYVLARDANGTLETRIASRLCQDSMSGAVFPYTARLTIDDQAPVLGCARGLNDPLPAEPGH